MPLDAPSLLVLHDGAAGNRRQAMALAEALSPRVQELVLAPRAPWRFAAPRRLPFSTHAFGPAFARALATPPPLAIGCGRQAALATRLLRARGSRVVQVLDPRLAPRHWDAVVAPAHDGLAGPNVLRLRGSLHPVDTAWLAKARTAMPGLGAMPGPRRVLLLGGPTRRCPWGEASVLQAFEALRAAQGRDGGALWISGSRRTPPALVTALRSRLDAAHAPPGTLRLWASETDGPNPYAGLLGWAEALVVTADSANLLSEAAATEAPLWILGTDAVSGRLAALVRELLGSGRARRFEDGLAAGFTPYPLVPWAELPPLLAALRPLLGLPPA
jgi:mitochondrial fission protein ELM1